MAHVKFYECFPTIISQFDYMPNDIIFKNMKKYIKDARKNYKYHTKDTLYTISDFLNLRDIILKYTKIHLEKLGMLYDEIEITGMWANILFKGNVHPPHTHSNNILSGVYYIESGSSIQFFDPRPQSSILQPKNIPNNYNSTILEFKSTVGRGYIFPSWLVHWVPATDNERISISWNIILRGQYGQPGTLQNANI